MHAVRVSFPKVALEKSEYKSMCLGKNGTQGKVEGGEALSKQF